MSEYFDIFDANLSPAAPFRAERKEAHAQGLWHQTFDCWVLRRDAGGDKIVLQLRSMGKDNYPGTLDISASGHLAAGEGPMDGVREIEEELGLKVEPEDLFYLGLHKEAMDRPGFCVRHLSHTYFYEAAQPLSSYSPQESEVDGLFEINIADAIRLVSGETESVEAEGIAREGSAYKPARRRIVIADLCAAEDRCKVTKYYLKVFTLAALYLQGHRPLAI
jgi:isopentenyldiphosphate isomerase